MRISRKATGLTLAGVAVTGVTAAVVGTGASTFSSKNVSENRHYSKSKASAPVTPHASTTGHAMAGDGDGDADDRQRQRPATVSMTSSYAVTHVRRGRSVAVTRKMGEHWRTVGSLRWNDRHVRGVAVTLRHSTTLLVVTGGHVIRLVVPPHAVVVIADNGRIGVVRAWYLRAATRPTATPSSSATPTATPTHSMTPPAGTAGPTPSPTGSQAPVVGGLNGRSSTKW